MDRYTGSLVRFRDRDWVVLAEEADVMVLSPITGDQRNLCSVYLPVERENLQPSSYPLPNLDDVGDFQSARLLRDAARLLLRNGTTPLRSLGHISFRPRPYQLVPLMMSMKLNPVRLLIADDVGIGKTIEAGLIARELLDRGEIRSIMVLCPPRLCEQWHTELTQKFHIPTEVVRSNTLADLERNIPRQDQGIFEYYACLVASTDLIKTGRVRQHFLRHSPDLVIVDEANGCADSSYRAEQQRHQLLLEVAANPDRHLLLVTASPHSGIDKSFYSLLGLLGVTPENPENHISNHLVQRRRADVTRWLETETPFPERDHVEITYKLSGQYLDFFQQALRFCRKQAGTEGPHRRSFGLALEMLRCVMSSPAAARASLKRRKDARGAAVAPEEQQISEDTDTEEGTDDVELDLTPCTIDGRSFDKQALKDLAALAASAEQLKDESDAKIRAAMNAVAGLLRERYNPIVFCHFVESAAYVAKRLREALAQSNPEVVVGLVTGATPDTERHETLKQLFASDRRILVATDCLSEGVNLQEGFSAVVHYDLPWNPNRLEQREGRVDRFGQTSPKVKALVLFGTNNLIEAKVLTVLFRKTRLIRERLGVGMRLPIEDQFLERSIIGSDAVPGQNSDLDHILSEWDSIAEPARRVQLGYAQGPFESEEVARQSGIADSVLGDPRVVERFFRTASAFAGGFLSRSGPHWKLHANLLPGELRGRLPEGMGDLIGFEYPVPPKVEFISRNHPVTALLAEHTVSMALTKSSNGSRVSRVGVICSDAVSSLTVVLLCRIRFRVSEGEGLSVAEESVVWGFRQDSDGKEWLPQEHAESLLEHAEPSRNLSGPEKKDWATAVLRDLPSSMEVINGFAAQRSESVRKSYESLRPTSVSCSVEPCLPVDVLAVSIIIPSGVSRKPAMIQHANGGLGELSLVPGHNAERPETAIVKGLENCEHHEVLQACSDDETKGGVDMKSGGAKKPSQKIKGESLTEPVVEDQRIREAVDFINEKANETVYRGFLEIGNYILEKFFDGSMEQARSRNPKKSASFRALCGHPDLVVSPATLSIMLRVAAQEGLFASKKLPLEKLSYSHKAELVRVEDDATKIRLFKEVVKKSLSVRALHQRVKQERKALPTADQSSRASDKARVMDIERLLHNPIFSDAEKLKVLSAGKREKLRTQVEESFARLTQLVEDYSRLRLLLADPKTENDE